MIYADPDELVIITDPGDPLFCVRAELPIREADVRNVGRLGIIEPVVGRRRGDRVIVLDGRQRVRWAREVNRALRERGAEPMKVPVVIRMAEDDGEALEVAISANEIRQDGPVIERARKAARLHRLGRSLSEVATVFGVSKTSVQCWWRLLELHPDVQAAVAEGRARMSDALWELGKLPTDKQPAALAEIEQARPTSKARGGRRDSSGPRPGWGMLWRLKAVVKWVATHPGEVPEALYTVLLWIARETTDVELLRAVPALAGLLEEGTERNGRRRARRRNGHHNGAGPPVNRAADC